MTSSCKYGVIVVPGYSTYPYKNIGDYVQSIAALQYIPKDSTPEFLNRDKIDEVKSEVPIKTIMNGWWMAHPDKFPPGKDIIPLYVSFHLRPALEKDFFTKETIEHLIKHQPIGCRDQKTADMMQKYGIDAYYSGCLTLTLGKTFTHRKTADAKVYFVDPYVERFVSKHFRLAVLTIFRAAYNILFKFSKVKRIANQILKTQGDLSKRSSLLLAARIYATYSSVFEDSVLFNGVYISHFVSKKKYPTDKERLDLAHSWLTQYTTAKYVVTQRIHCALPCLGMGTPVIYGTQPTTINSGRLSGLHKLFMKFYYKNGKCHLNDTDFGLSKKIGDDFSFENKNDHLEMAKAIRSRVEEFINEQ